MYFAPTVFHLAAVGFASLPLGLERVMTYPTKGVLHSKKQLKATIQGEPQLYPSLAWNGEMLLLKFH